MARVMGASTGEGDVRALNYDFMFATWTNGEGLSVQDRQ